MNEKNKEKRILMGKVDGRNVYYPQLKLLDKIGMEIQRREDKQFMKEAWDYLEGKTKTFRMSYWLGKTLEQAGMGEFVKNPKEEE